MNISKWLTGINGSALAAPALVIIMLALMVLPVPSFALDVFFSFNISLSIIVLLTALYTVSPLDFMAFPAVLLITTMLRLSLNVASTRIVLTEGHNGPDAAGKVIEAFGHFLIGGNYLVGVVVFIILTIINFVVITKGAGRIAEVGARFALDAMPGKQMAIDADLNAGLIGESEARERRKSVAQEAEFYGAMDGASKYVRGDAVAGIVIVIVNMVGGLLVGMIQHELDFAKAIETYTMLAIGDGLVAQLPSLIISVAAGAVVSRVVSDEDVGSQMVNQLLMKPQVLYITAGIIGGLGMIPGMPHLAFWLLAALIGGSAYRFQHKPKTTPEIEQLPNPTTPTEVEEVSWKDLAPIQTLGLEVGYRLITLVDKAQGGELFRRIKGVRRKFAQEVGFLPPSIHINDNLELSPSSYRITLKGVEIGLGETQPGQFMAINPGMVTGNLSGTQTTDPTFGLPAVWIGAQMREQAQAMGYTVVDASTVVATHLNQLMMEYAGELLGRQELQALLDHIGKDSPKLVEDLTPKLLPLSTLQKILQNLLFEDVHIRDMHTIIETLVEYAPQTQDANFLTSMVRIGLGRAIAQQIVPGSKEIPVMALDNRLEQLLLQSMQSSGPDGSAIEPGLADTLMTQTAQSTQMQEQLGYIPVLLVPAALRPMLARFLRRSLPQLKVLSHAELPDSYTIKVTNLVGALI
jgi:flagellar biosynthesis protein FlhA